MCVALVFRCGVVEKQRSGSGSSGLDRYMKRVPSTRTFVYLAYIAESTGRADPQHEASICPVSRIILPI